MRTEEKHLLRDEQLRVMTESGNIDDICRTLQDAGYGSETENFRLDNYERILSESEAALTEEIETLKNNNAVFDIFAYPSDYHNIKTLLKSEFLGIDRSDILLSTGTIKPDKMAEIVRERNRSLMTEFMHRAIEEACDTHARTRDPQVVDFICDKYCFQDIMRIAEKSGNDFVKGYVRLWIDTVNLKTFMRVRKMQQPWGYFSEIYVPGGNVELQTFVNGYEEDPAQLAARFAPFDIASAVAEGSEQLASEGTFTALERECDNALINFVKEAKYITFGLESMVAFLVAKQMEVKNIRILITGKMAKMEPEVIRERLRVTYA